VYSESLTTGALSRLLACSTSLGTAEGLVGVRFKVKFKLDNAISEAFTNTDSWNGYVRSGPWTMVSQCATTADALWIELTKDYGAIVGTPSLGGTAECRDRSSLSRRRGLGWRDLHQPMAGRTGTGDEVLSATFLLLD
jgi:hypothetical protein